MLNETSMLYKLSILYMLSKVEYPISNNHISNFLLENDFTDYFNIQQLMSELLEDSYVTEETVRNRTFYKLSDEGHSALKLLSRELSETLKKEIEDYIKRNKIELREEMAVRANYHQEGIDNYIASMYIEENSTKILEINISVSTEAEADKMCANWEKSSAELYPLLIEKLLFRKN